VDLSFKGYHLPEFGVPEGHTAETYLRALCEAGAEKRYHEDATSQKVKERPEFFVWLNNEIEKRILEHEQYRPDVTDSLEKDMNVLKDNIKAKDNEILVLSKMKQELNKEIAKYDIWHDYSQIERKFWSFIKDRDYNMWIVLDPVITVHPDQVTFEAFSLDESTYGCLSASMDEFDLLQKPKLGTTNIDFSAKLAREMERFRTYTNVELSVNPDGFVIDNGLLPEHVEKKIDLPETWIKGFNQVSAASTLSGIDVEISPVDMYDICSFLRRHKAHKSPRYMKWMLTPGERVKILFEPFKTVLELKAIYNGQKKREEKIWGRRRWLTMEKVIPLSKSFKIRLFGMGMPQFIIADLGTMKMTIGFTSWSSNDWVKGTAFNIMAGFTGDNSYNEVYRLLKNRRYLSIDSINNELDKFPKSKNKAGIGMLIKRGEGYFDPINNTVRFRQLCNVPINENLYSDTAIELAVNSLKDTTKDFILMLTSKNEFIIKNSYNYKLNKETKKVNTRIVIDEDGQISNVECSCKEFNNGPRNISAPCAHILALYVTCSKFLLLNFEPNLEYKMNDIWEMLI
jgi:hypothetical protein